MRRHDRFRRVTGITPLEGDFVVIGEASPLRGIGSAGWRYIFINLRLCEALVQTIQTAGQSHRVRKVWMRRLWFTLKGIGKIWSVVGVGRFHQGSTGFVIGNIALAGIREQR